MIGEAGTQIVPTDDALVALGQRARQRHITPFWPIVDTAHPHEPISPLVPHVWRWQEWQELLEDACRLIGTADRGAERRAFSFLNPGLGGRYGTTHTIIAGVQKILPGEIATMHRHTPDALRFIIEGQGAYTVVEGEKVALAPGDFVLTPNWCLHDHGNESDEPVTWMDALDVPLVNLLDASFFEQYPGQVQERDRPPEGSLARYGGHFRPAWEPAPQDQASPLWVYRWADTERALARLARVAASPFDDVALEYTSPATGGAVFPTLTCWIQVLRPGVHTRAHRHTSSVVYFVKQGHGCSVIGGQRYEWGPRDFFVVPNWAWHEHLNRSASEEAVLFSVQDRPALQALGLYREQALDTSDGWQTLAEG